MFAGILTKPETLGSSGSTHRAASARKPEVQNSSESPSQPVLAGTTRPNQKGLSKRKRDDEVIDKDASLTPTQGTTGLLESARDPGKKPRLEDDMTKSRNQVPVFGHNSNTISASSSSSA